MFFSQEIGFKLNFVNGNASFVFHAFSTTELNVFEDHQKLVPSFSRSDSGARLPRLFLRLPFFTLFPSKGFLSSNRLVSGFRELVHAWVFQGTREILHKSLVFPAGFEQFRESALTACRI